MMNFANDIDVYQIWANMVCYDQGYFDPEQRPYTCVYASRRRGHSYVHTDVEIFKRYGQHMCLYEEMPAVLAGTMGDFSYLARFETEEEAVEFAKYVIEKKEG
jgi:hypothetical protein